MSDAIDERGIEKALSAIEKLRAVISTLAGDDAEADLIRDTIEGEIDVTGILRRVVIEISEEEARIEGLKAYAADVGRRKSRLEKRAERLRALLTQLMEAAERQNEKLDIATITLRPVAPSVIVTEKADLPSKYFKAVEPELDKKTLLADLKAIEAMREARAKLPPEERSELATTEPIPEIPGATLSNGGTTIQIRMT